MYYLDNNPPVLQMNISAAALYANYINNNLKRTYITW